MSSKLLECVSVKLDGDDLAALDRYVRAREQETQAPFSRSLAVREILRRAFSPPEVSCARARYAQTGTRSR